MSDELGDALDAHLHTRMLDHDDGENEAIMRSLVDRASIYAHHIGWDLADFCDLAAKAMARRHAPDEVDSGRDDSGPGRLPSE